jgi:hypothetical protein
MNRIVCYLRIFINLVLLNLISSALCVGQEQLPQENFYNKSLHYTNRGIEFIYSKEQGGLERLTGLPASALGCLKSNCHATSCDVCHLRNADGKSEYSSDSAVAHEACKICHGDMAKDNPDVHFSKGMKCMDCHSTREIHGDGLIHNTYSEPGFFDTRCERCHSSISKSTSHTVHKARLDCSTCHVREIPTCYNCHIETRLKQGKESSIQLKNMLFLVNHDGKVKPANLLTYVYQGKTMMTFAPSFPHSIQKGGRQCRECHDTKIVQEIKKGTFRFVRWENNTIRNIEGVIPVLDGMKGDLMYLDRKDTMWIPLQNPSEPLLNYSGYCTPMTPEQFEKLTHSQGTR